MSSEADFARLLPTWLELTSRTEVSLGLEPEDAIQRAQALFDSLRAGRRFPEGWKPEVDEVEVLHALVALVCSDEVTDPTAALADVDLAFHHVSSLPWPVAVLGGPRELLARCAFQGWRIARRVAKPPEIAKWLGRVRATSDLFAPAEEALAKVYSEDLTPESLRFFWRPQRLDHEERRPAAERALAASVSERTARANELRLDDPDLLLCVCEILQFRLEGNPLTVREDAEFFYRFLESPARQIGLHDEREYFLGELALLAGAACRFLFRLDEAKTWLQRAEANFALVQNANAHWARVSYQRLALATEERKFDEVLDVVGLWATTFRRLEMYEDELKCRFLEGAIRWELGESAKTIEINQQIFSDAEALLSARLAAQAAGNLVRCYAVLGQSDNALVFARKAQTLLQQTGNRVHLVKLQWSIAELLKGQGKRVAALEAYRQAQSEARELGMRGDLAALHLVIGDLLLEAGQEAQAEWEIRAALPIIDEEKMVPEGIAALSLLRESLRRRQIDKQALRDLHGYFQEK